MKKSIMLLLICACSMGNQGCENSDDIQRKQQERILMEGTAEIGMPAIKNFRRKKLMKDIIELCDQDGLVTYLYSQAEQTGKLVFLGETIGYPIPAATQYTNPQKYEMSGATLPQADPDGLFSPSSAEGTWVMMKDPNGGKVRPVYIEPRCICSPFRLNTN